jgi:tetratricopeptide (TPR) repeat protein
MPLNERAFRYEGPAACYGGGKQYLKRRHYGMARIAFEWAARLWSESLGQDHPHVGSALAYEGWCEAMEGDFASAAANYERALRIAIGVVGPEGERALNWAGDLELIQVRLAGGDGPLPGLPDRRDPLIEFLPD